MNNVFDFSFVYDGKKISSETLKPQKRGDSLVYRVEDIEISREIRRYGNAEWALLRFKNIGKTDSKIISEVYDIDTLLPLPCEKNEYEPYGGYAGQHVKIFRSSGPKYPAQCVVGSRIAEFLPVADVLWHKKYTNAGGRSSQVIMPFFEMTDYKHERGALLAIGWTGQWGCRFCYEDNKVRIQSGVEELSFILHPDEQVRTASILLLPFENGSVNAHNDFRRIIKEHFTPTALRNSPAPFATSVWGGFHSEHLCELAQKFSDQKLGTEYYWIDAGWYGESEIESNNAFEGEWAAYTGNWSINRYFHPNGLKDVFSKTKELGMKNLLWLEPERARKQCGFYDSHKDMYIDIGLNNVLLDLSEAKPRQYMLDTVSHYVETLSLDCYRQDFNIDPYDFWNAKDAENRKGITQLKYIEGLYWVLDKLLEKFPHLVIDNCASGGQRIDLEMTMRSVPLWRSDMNCVYDCNPVHTQSQTMGLMRWLPYHAGSVSIRMDDEYIFRSGHSTAMVYSYDESAINKKIGALNLDTVHRLVDEYKALRGFYDKDYYPVFGLSADEEAWGGWQFHDPEKDEGTVAAFRRSKSLSKDVLVPLCALDPQKTYTFTDTKTGETTELPGKQLLTEGLPIELKDVSSSVIYIYRRKQ